MSSEISMDEVNIYISFYQMKKNGEYPAPTKNSKKALEKFLGDKKKMQKYIKDLYERGHVDMLNNIFKNPHSWEDKMKNNNDIYAENGYNAMEYKKTIKNYMKKHNIFEKFIKTRMNIIKKELLDLLYFN